jgi:glycosyltransferase involved in cell wall biosynthesis
MQKCDFRIEIIIHDDASTDNTAEIIEEYEHDYPGVIKPVYQEKNQYSKGVGSIMKSFQAKINGKYIALCEGDDYWTDPLKLQKQMDILEANPEFSMVVGGYKKLDPKTGYTEEITRRGDKVLETGSSSAISGFCFTLEDKQNAWITQTLTVLFRKEDVEDIDFTQYRYLKDVHLYYHILKKGKGFCISSILGVYRMHENGVFSSLKPLNRLLSNFYPYQELYRVNRDEFSRRKYLSCCMKLIKYYTHSKIKHKEPSLPRLIKIALGLSKTGGEFLRVIKISLPLINDIKVKKIIPKLKKAI